MNKALVKIGVVCGRFQVFHNGHLNYVLSAKEQCEHLIIGITSPDISVSPVEVTDLNRGSVVANPCTYFERMSIIKRAMLENGLTYDQFDIVPFPIGKPELIKSYIPDESVCYFTVYDDWGKEKVHRMSELGYGTVVLWDDRSKELSSSHIREKIMNGIDWKPYVPAATYNYFIEHKIDERVKNLMQKYV